MLESRTVRWSLACAGVCVLLLAATWFLLVSPRRAEAAELRSQTESAESRASLLQQQIALLTAQYGDLEETRGKLGALRVQLPATADVPRLVRSLRSNADAAGVTLNSVAPGSAAALTGTNGQATASGVVSVPVTLEFTGSYIESTLYVKYLQTRLQRSFLVTGMQVAENTAAAAGTTGGTTTASDEVTFTLNGQVFALPDSTTPVAPAPAAGTAPAPAGGTAGQGETSTTS